MSTIRVDNFGPSAGGTTYSARGVGKAWLAFNHATATIRASENVSSLTDSGTGRLGVNFTNGFSAAGEYSVSGLGRLDDTNTDNQIVDLGLQRASSSTATSGVDMTNAVHNASTLWDAVYGSVTCMGDLA